MIHSENAASLRNISSGYSEYSVFESHHLNSGFLQTVRRNLSESFLAATLEALDYTYNEYDGFRWRTTVLVRKLLLQSLFCLGMSNTSPGELEASVKGRINEEMNLVTEIIQELERGERLREANYWPTAVQKAAEKFVSEELRLFEEPQQAVRVLASFVAERYGAPIGNGLTNEDFYVQLVGPRGTPPFSRGDVVQVGDGGGRIFSMFRLSRNQTQRELNRRRYYESSNQKLSEALLSLKDDCLSDAYSTSQLAKLIFERTVDAMPFTAYLVATAIASNNVPLFWESSNTEAVLRVATPVNVRLCPNPTATTNVDFNIVVAL
ncbi:hypothetical protein QR680_014188 [Steinernema hermaphroditum]|uniref:Uncharacterized protein n=1 Tax=Steinernema hermaphroditum TaxID=289476 RepID=A0AA39M3G9_9BILA|nr:hypothetical protein QR680_014188 [Steinernema hermaphroditum]